MKTKLILASLLALTLSSNAQYISTSGTPPGSSSQVFQAGDGAGSIHYNGGSGGVLIQSSGGDRALLELQSPSGSGVGTNRTVFQALSTVTYLDISGGTIPLSLQASGGNVGIGTTSPSFQLELTTNSAAKPTSNAWTVSSDLRLKKNVRNYEGGLKEIMEIRPVWFTYNGEAGMPQETGVGVIAQELQKVAPYMVNDWTYYATPEDRANRKGTNYLGVDNGAMTYMLINAVKEQQKQIEEQKQLIAELQSKVSNSTGLNDINGANGFQMNQNEPNPFTNETVVKYTLPQTVKNAQMTVYDLTGKQIVAFPITEMGSSSITITSEKLAAGIYIYSIVADGKIVDSKRMIVAEK